MSKKLYQQKQEPHWILAFSLDQKERMSECWKQVSSTQCNFKRWKTFKVTNVRTVSNFHAGDGQKEWMNGKVSEWVPSVQLYDGEDINLILYPPLPSPLLTVACPRNWKWNPLHMVTLNIYNSHPRTWTWLMTKQQENVGNFRDQWILKATRN